MDADQLFAVDGEHVEGIIVAQVSLDGERKSGEVGMLLEIGGMHAGLVESASVMGDIVIGMLERPCEAL